jgi:hypothetical protein
VEKTMISKNKLKDNIKTEFESILPNILNKVAKQKVIPSPLGMDISLRKRINLKLSQVVIATSLIVGIFSYGGYSYYTPNTIMSISVTPNVLNTFFKLNTNETIGDPDDEINFTMTINNYSVVVEVEADSEVYNQALKEMNLSNISYQQSLKILLSSLDQSGRIDISNNIGQVKFKILDSNTNRLNRVKNYVITNLSKDVGFKDSKMILVDQVEYNVSSGLTTRMHPAKAMAINEIMLNSSEYNIEDLTRMDKLDLIRIMMKIKRDKR